ncbi:hypothetical protein MUP46_04230 [Patescibacteria group bacterium]|nr:hypothetical protein [Patescibacteria group bacterium]
MSSKTTFYIAALIGSVIGAYIPALWGAGLFSFSSVIFSAIGGIAGIVIVWKFFK